MIFTYWDGDKDCLLDFIKDWSAVADPAVYTDADVLPILASFDETWPVLYSRIRIQSCKSDVARLALLYYHGGLYVDAHTGRVNPPLVAALFARLANVEMVIAAKPSGKTLGHFELMNGGICARARSPLLAGVLADAMENLSLHARRQDGGDKIGYNIAAMTGAWVLRMHLFLRLDQVLAPRHQYAGRVEITVSDTTQPRAFQFYVHYGYRRDGEHWSQRQGHEPLFTGLLPS